MALKAQPCFLMRDNEYTKKVWKTRRPSFLHRVLFGPRSYERYAIEGIRILLFEELGLTHTCCKSGFQNDIEAWLAMRYADIRPRMSDRDAKLRRAEERDATAFLDECCREAEVRFRKSDQPISSFFPQFAEECVQERFSRLNVDRDVLLSLRQDSLRLLPDS